MDLSNNRVEAAEYGNMRRPSSVIRQHPQNRYSENPNFYAPLPAHTQRNEHGNYYKIFENGYYNWPMENALRVPFPPVPIPAPIPAQPQQNWNEIIQNYPYEDLYNDCQWYRERYEILTTKLKEEKRSVKYYKELSNDLMHAYNNQCKINKYKMDRRKL